LRQDSILSKRLGGLAGWIVWPKPTPLAPLDLTIEVPGRISTDGCVVRPFDREQLRARLVSLKDAHPESITVSLINSFANNEHELAVAELLREELPGIPLSLSCEILPEIMEYERTVTTVANAYIKPTLERYLSSLQDKLGETELRVVRSDGGLASVGIAKEHCASLLYSVSSSHNIYRIARLRQRGSCGRDCRGCQSSRRKNAV
jgi:5-oxoprolinase (ATP-hydrolysing)